VTWTKGAALGVRPSGQQLEISWRKQRATVVEVGGGIRFFEVAGRPVLEPYALDAKRDGAHGTPLIPWPNRLGDGRYRFDGVEYQLALSEPERHNAIHGLLCWRAWRVLRHSKDRVTMGTWLFPMDGYPFLLDVEVEYALGEDGLTVTTTAINRGPCACPYGAGQHPYLSPGAGRIDDCTLQLEAATRIVTDEERQLPIGTDAVEGSAYDFRQARSLGTNGSISLSPTCLATQRGGRGRASAVRTAATLSCGWTSTTRSSRFTPATP
jgi:aldose 1-epimerase